MLQLRLSAGDGLPAIGGGHSEYAYEALLEQLTDRTLAYLHGGMICISRMQIYLILKLYISI